jgi:hypothetical protein
MQIPFSAYADDCTVTGEIDLPADRLSDFLATTYEFDVAGAAFRALDDGRVVEAESTQILRDDLCVVAATGPRGREDRRIWTRQHPVRVRVGPYVVVGYMHAPPTIDPVKSLDRRHVLALTSSVLEYTEAGEPVRVELDAALVNQAKVEAVVVATEGDLRLARGLTIDVPADSRAKDLTGDAWDPPIREPGEA